MSTRTLSAGLTLGLALTVIAPGATSAAALSPTAPSGIAALSDATAAESEPTAPIESTTSLTVETPTIRVGESVTLRVDVVGDNPTGLVSIRDGDTLVAQGALESGAVALTVDDLAVGTHELVASYSGDDAHGASESQPAVVTVDKWVPTITLELPGTVQASSQVTALVTVHAESLDGTGEVTLERNGAQIAIGTLAAGRVTLSFPAGAVDIAGSSVTATFAGDDAMNPATTQAQLKVVPRASVTAVSISPNPSTKAGTAVTATVTVRVAAGAAPTGTVLLTGAGTRSATLANGRVVVSLGNSLTAGAYTVTAAYQGDPSTTASSGKAALTITKLGSAMALSTTKVGYGARPKVSVIVSGPPLTASGTVQARLGSAVVATSRLASGRATLILPAWTPGTRRVTVQYSGDANHALGKNAVDVTITKARSSASASVPRITYGSTANVKVTVRGAGSTPAGAVKIYRGAKAIAGGNLNKGRVSVRLPRLNPGRYPLTIKYLGSSRHQPVSTKIVYTVAKAKPTMSVSVLGSLTPAGVQRLSVVVKKGTPAPSGRVTVSRTGKVIGSVRLSSRGAGTVTLPDFGAGSYSLKVSYTGDARYAPVSKTTALKISPPPNSVPNPPKPLPPARPADVDCGDFSTHAQAQAYFEKYYPYYGDFARLDADHDMLACETLP